MECISGGIGDIVSRICGRSTLNMMLLHVSRSCESRLNVVVVQVAIVIAIVAVSSFTGRSAC